MFFIEFSEEECILVHDWLAAQGDYVFLPIHLPNVPRHNMCDLQQKAFRRVILKTILVILNECQEKVFSC